MTRPWRTLDRVSTAEGPLELRQRGERDFLIVIAGRVLMSSMGHRSELALATLACQDLPRPQAPHVLIGGLGMGFTLRAALDALPATARVVVAELSPEIVAWCRGALAPLTAAATADPRVAIEITDVAAAIAGATAGRFDAILLDLYEGPNPATQGADDPFYSASALARAHAALATRGVLAIWSEDPDPTFERRFEATGFSVSRHRPGRGGRSHAVYVGRRR